MSEIHGRPEEGPRTHGFIADEPGVAERPQPGSNDASRTSHGEGQVPAPRDGVGTALAVTDFGEDAGVGFENTRLEEQVTPFLRMAQGLSPELNRQKGEFIEGLSLGDIFNTASREFYRGDVGIEMIIYGKDYHYGKWLPRDTGGGFRGAITPEDPLVRETLARMTAKYGKSARFRLPRFKDGRWSDEPARDPETGEAIELVETGHLYVAYAAEGLAHDNYQMAIVPFTSTALGAYSSYVTRHNNATFPQRSGGRVSAPIWAYVWRLTTFGDTRGQGKDFSNWRLDLVPKGAAFPQALYAARLPELYRKGRELALQFNQGAFKVDREQYEKGMQGAPYEPGADDAPPF